MVLDLMILSVGFRFTYKIGCVEKFLPISSLLYVMLPSSIRKHLLAARVNYDPNNILHSKTPNTRYQNKPGIER